jgi:hypothetical protein
MAARVCPKENKTYEHCSKICSNNSPQRVAAREKEQGRRSVLINEDIPVIRAAKGSNPELAALWGVSTDTIRKIKTRISWKHVQ